MTRHFIVGIVILTAAIWMSPHSFGITGYVDDPEHLSVTGATFSWADAEAKSVKLWVEYRDEDGEWREANLGSGFLISPDGLFVTAYHVMRYCLEHRRDKPGFALDLDCSTAHPVLRYRAGNGAREYAVRLISHLTERDATNGKNVQTPDEIIKHRDFVIGRLQGRTDERFAYWKIRDFNEGRINIDRPRANFELRPLTPPQKVFIAGYPMNRTFSIAHGFLNIAEDYHRGYFALPLDVYEDEYLTSQGIPQGTSWGITVENHMSGGAVVDSLGYLVGLLTNGSAGTVGVLSIENVLETFFSRTAEPKAEPAVALSPETLLYLRRQDPSAATRHAQKELKVEYSRAEKN